MPLRELTSSIVEVCSLMHKTAELMDAIGFPLPCTIPLEEQLEELRVELGHLLEQRKDERDDGQVS